MIVSYGETSPIDPTRRAIGQYNYAPQQQSYQQPQALQQLGMQQQPFDPSAGIGEFERRQFQPQALQQLGMQQQPYQQEQQPYQQEPQALQQLGMRQQSYQPLPQMPTMQPFLQQFRTQQRPYQNSDEGYRSGSAYGPLRQLNMLAPLNSNALNFSY